MYRNFKYLSTTTIVMMYNTLVRSLLEYANCVLYGLHSVKCQEIAKGADESYKNGKAVI